MFRSSYVPDGSKWNNDDIVISGISARLPNCDSVEEFQEKLLAKVDLITDEPRRFQNGLYGAIKRYGLLKDLSKFDAGFFNIHPKQADRMDPQIRNLLEVAYEATIDAGLHPNDLKGTKTGVVIGIASSETQDKWSQMPNRINGYEYTGCTRTMFANRISYLFDIKGPSYSIDTASSTTLVAFQQAYDMIRDGVCDACFVCGTDLVLNPCVCLMFQCLNMLSPEGKCKAFDISGDGYVRSEAVIAVLLQKAKHAKRIYANVLAAGSNCDGYKDDGITFPSCEMQTKLFKRVSKIAGIDPKTIDFMEAHGSATRVGDPQEMNAVTEVFTKGRKKPLNTGSIKSNMGHGEPASALSGVIKICVAMECGILPPNLHYKIPNPDIPALLDGRLKVITEPTPWEGGIVAVNSFGVGGANGHALLLSNKKQKKLVKDNIYRLVCVTGVTESAVYTMLNKIKSLPTDPNLYGLLNNIHRKNIEGHGYRGFMLMNAENIIRITRVQQEYRKMSLCIILPGLETCWKSLDVDTMKMQIFQDSIATCEKELKTAMENVNLNSVLGGLGTERSPLNLVIGVTALQIGLIHILRELEITPTVIIGSNIGEIAAGYAKGAYTLRQAMLLAFKTGSILQQFYYPSALVKSDISARESNPPADVSTFVKFRSDCTLFSGPKQSVTDFVKRLTTKNYEAVTIDGFVVDVFGIIRNSGCVLNLENEFKKILTNISETAKWSAKYLINALTREAIKIEAIIAEAECPVVLEIGPHSSFLNTFPTFAFISDEANITNFLLSIGELFNIGFHPQIQNLYSKVQFPVPHGTPMIQSMIEWDHSQNWNVVSFAPKDGQTAGELDIVVDFNKEEFKWLTENKLCDQQVFPKAFYIHLLRKAMSKFQNKPMTDFPLTIENLFFIRETPVSEEGDPVKFTVIVLEASGKFEIREGGYIVVCGEVRIPKFEILAKEQIPASLLLHERVKAETEIDADNVYRFLNVNQYQYNNTFKSITSFNYENNTAKVKTSKWIPYMEAFIQILILNVTCEVNASFVVSFIRKIVINPQKSENDEVVVHYSKKWNALKSRDIEMQGIELKTKSLRKPSKPNITCSKFVPFICENLQNAAETSLALALENFMGYNGLKIAELINNAGDSLLTPLIKNANPFFHGNTTIYCNDPTPSFAANAHPGDTKFLTKNLSTEPLDSSYHLMIAKNMLHDTTALQNLVKSIRTNGCLLLEENPDQLQFEDDENVQLIARITSSKKIYYVLKKVNGKVRNNPRVITISSPFDCMQKLQHIPNDNAGLLIAVNKPFEVNGIIPFVKSMSAQSQARNLSVILIEDKDAAVFSLTNPLYAEQLQKNYPINVFKNGCWGTYISTSFCCDLLRPTESAFLGLNFEIDSQTTIDLVKANPAIYKLNSQEKVCKVLYATVNMRDVQMYRGVSVTPFSLPGPEILKSHLGFEFAGYEGTKRVFGLVSGGALATSVVADKDYLWSIPEDWSFEEATTIPYAYALSYYGLKIRGNIQTGSCVLIDGLNSVAIAATYIAFRHHCNIFLLLNDELHVPLLRKLFPLIKNENLIITKENNFHLEVLQRTGGKGVHLLFNTLPVKNYKFRSYVSSLAENGICVYLNSDQYLEEDLGSSGNMRCLTFHRIAPSCLFDDTNVILKKKISKFIADGLSEGVILPLPYSTFSHVNITEAFSFISKEFNLSKAIIKIGQDSNEILAQNRVYFDGSKSYIILAGNTDFGIYTTVHLIAQGIRNLVLIESTTESKNKQLSNFLLKKINENTNYCNISNVTINDFDISSCEFVLQKANQIAPLGGIFDFTQFGSQVPATISNLVVEPKVAFLSNMDAATRKSFPSLRYFVSFSLVELEYRLPDYSVFAYVNGVIQNIMRNRKDCGLNGTLIQWGRVGESFDDILFNNLKSLQAILAPQSVVSCLQTIHQLLESPEPIVSSFHINECFETATDSKGDVIVEGVAKFLGIKNPKSVLSTLTMLELGLDSLISTDIQQFLEINYGVTLSTQEIRELTFEKLKKLADNLNSV